MPLFQIKADGYFKARDITDALDKLGTYYKNSAQGIDQESFLENGEIMIVPVLKAMEDNNDNKLIPNCNG